MQENIPKEGWNRIRDILTDSFKEDSEGDLFDAYLLSIASLGDIAKVLYDGGGVKKSKGRLFVSLVGLFRSINIIQRELNMSSNNIMDNQAISLLNVKIEIKGKEFNPHTDIDEGLDVDTLDINPDSGKLVGDLRKIIAAITSTQTAIHQNIITNDTSIYELVNIITYDILRLIGYLDIYLEDVFDFISSLGVNPKASISNVKLGVIYIQLKGDKFFLFEGNVLTHIVDKDNLVKSFNKLRISKPVDPRSVDVLKGLGLYLYNTRLIDGFDLDSHHIVIGTKGAKTVDDILEAYYYKIKLHDRNNNAF